MRVTKEQVRRYAEAVVAYDDARNAVLNPEVARWHHVEPVLDAGDLDAIAEAVGAKVETHEGRSFVTSHVEAYGVEFYCIEKKK